MATMKSKEQRQAIAGALALAQRVGQFLASKLWLDHDVEADVLTINLKRPQRALETIDLEKEGLLLHYRGKELVGITVLEASKR